MSTALVIAVVYFGVLSFAVSFFLRKKVKSGSDFVTGNKLAWPLVTAAFVLAPLGSGHTLSLWEASAGMGASVLWWGMISGGIFVPLFLLWFGPWFTRLNVKTFPEGMGKIFGKKIGWLISAVFPAQLIGICIAEVTATATAFYALSGGKYPLKTCIFLAVFFTIIYIVFAGLMQVAWMNLFNAIMLVAGSFVAVFYTGSWLSSGRGGWESISNFYAEAGTAWKTSILHFSPDVIFGIMLPCLILLVFMCSASQAQCQPMLLARSQSDIRRGVFWASLVNSMVTYPWVILALVGMTIPAIAALPDAAKLAVPALALEALPSWMVGLLMIALLAATLSTTSILILSSSHIIVHDILRGVVHPKMNDKTFLWLTRLMILICAVLVIIPALKLTLMLPIFFWTFSFAIPVFGVYLIGMLWKVNRVAAWTTILAGYAANFLWTFAAPTWLPEYLSNNVVYPTTIATILFGVVMNLILPGDPPYIRKLKKETPEVEAGV